MVNLCEGRPVGMNFQERVFLLIQYPGPDRWLITISCGCWPDAFLASLSIEDTAWRGFTSRFQPSTLGELQAFPCPWKTAHPQFSCFPRQGNVPREVAAHHSHSHPWLPCMASGFCLPSQVLSYELKEHLLCFMQHLQELFCRFSDPLVYHNTRNEKLIISSLKN